MKTQIGGLDVEVLEIDTIEGWFRYRAHDGVTRIASIASLQAAEEEQILAAPTVESVEEEEVTP